MYEDHDHDCKKIKNWEEKRVGAGEDSLSLTARDGQESLSIAAAELICDIVYQTCLDSFEAKQHKIRGPPRKSRRQREMEMLRKQKRNLKKQMKTAPVEEQTGL
ncbi:histone acetyltransferase [Plakobranchus ocellatus]|uniref:Histone acetyltransferase n=1 Tax=Plakobranchus ocellatus TaxID=259542 RepID=A0AAV3YK89_9GAST|nr:histone acetyltransferase [Plakobranchus ocellatus]